MPNILLTNYYNKDPLEIIQKFVPPGFKLLILEQPGHEEVIRRIPKADYLLVGGRTKIDKKTLAAAANLKMIQRSGVGLDSLDLDAIRELNIPLYVNKGVNARSVAEHAVMLMLATLKKLTNVNAMTHSDQWVKHDMGISCQNLYQKQVGLIGFGKIGRNVARILKGFGAKVVYFKNAPISREEEDHLGVSYLELSELLKSCDIISLHCPGNTQTMGLIGQNEISLTKQGVIFVNTARGGIIDENALLQALKDGHIAAAGLDVFDQEPLRSDHPFLKQENLVLTPHIAGITAESFKSMMSKAFENIYLFANGRVSEIEGAKIL